MFQVSEGQDASRMDIVNHLGVCQSFESRITSAHDKPPMPKSLAADPQSNPSSTGVPPENLQFRVKESVFWVWE